VSVFVPINPVDKLPVTSEANTGLTGKKKEINIARKTTKTLPLGEVFLLSLSLSRWRFQF